MERPPPAELLDLSRIRRQRSVRAALEGLTATIALAALASALAAFGRLKGPVLGAWMPAGTLPAPVMIPLLLSFALTALGLRTRSPWGRRSAALLALLLGAVLLLDAGLFLVRLAAGRVESSYVLPLGLPVGTILLAWLLVVRPARSGDAHGARVSRRAVWREVAGPA